VIENFLRRPHSFGEYLADGVRALGFVSVIVAAIWWSATDAGILAFALPGLMLPRFVGVRPGFDVSYGVVVLIAAWSNVLDLYRVIDWWDIAMHFFATGLISALLYLTLAHRRIVASPGGSGFSPVIPAVLVPAFALALSALWEMVEWAGYTFISDEIFVAYDDTIGDMAVGGLGGLVAGLIVGYVRLMRERPRSGAR